MFIARLSLLNLLLILHGTSISFGQEIRVSFEEMWLMALDNNIQIKNAELLVEKSASLKGTAWDLGSLEFDFTRGQQNSALIDNMYTVRQGLGAPFTISATKKYYQSEEMFFEKHVNKVTREIKKQLRTYYYNWLYENSLIGILDSSISVYKKAEEFAALQYEMGDSNLLSKALLSSELQRLLIRRDLHLVNLQTIQNEIKTLINTDSLIIPAAEKLGKIDFQVPPKDQTISVEAVPEVMTQRYQVEVMDRYYRLNKSSISPSLYAGYYNQELDHVKGFQGWHLGFSFPLFFMPQKARSQAAYIELSRAENQYEFERLKATQEIESLISRYEQMMKSLDFYEEERLDNARLIKQNANILYESGSIGYIEYVQNLTTAREILEEYTYLLKEHNQFVIDLFYYLDQ